jgi:hypothetical protein
MASGLLNRKQTNGTEVYLPIRLLLFTESSAYLLLSGLRGVLLKVLDCFPMFHNGMKLFKSGTSRNRLRMSVKTEKLMGIDEDPRICSTAVSGIQVQNALARAGRCCSGAFSHASSLQTGTEALLPTRRSDSRGRRRFSDCKLAIPIHAGFPQ